jgi:hypothetical protein
MKIALDYDDTYTQDPEFWLKFIDMVAEHGHEVILVTMRAPYERHKLDQTLLNKISAEFTNNKAKRPFVEEKGIHIDVWIDDNPHYVDQDHWLMDAYKKWMK